MRAARGAAANIVTAPWHKAKPHGAVPREAVNDNVALPRTRAEALQIGSVHYFTGKPCRHGHIAPRITSQCICTECSRLAKQRKRIEDPDYFKLKKAEFRRNNPGVHAARARDYRARNIEKVRETERLYVLKNPLAKIAKDANRRAKKNASGSHTKDELKDIIRLQKYKCAVCLVSIRDRSGRHLDHIIPLSKGGRNDRQNLQFLCVACNLSKGNKDPEDFMRTRGFLL